ncbi:SDR family NAD(P)-dependent oxidoreductase [Robiginitomaculum antarcticum]|uniref:SDR family NAD(P)-dependent oxidoreductase n=1 Tax=Robiginitomaculum antarcticum TaxID=437507 RepID=UPI000368D9C7|nr:SDR family NAD(P)-dependent oxidoreductase [Robiginitomaculum antarcticum]
MTPLASFSDNMRVIVIGATGGIGRAFIESLAAHDRVTDVYALSRTGAVPRGDKIKPLTFDFSDVETIKAGAEVLRETGKFDLIIVATGLLHGNGISPEKSTRDLSHDAFAKSFAANVAGPALTAKYFLPLLKRDGKTVFTALSARVGSISDNRMGGWYAYRAAKAALNMVLKNLSIEHGRRFKESIIVGLHPGTVDTDLSKPFQGNVPDGKLFTAEYSAAHLLDVIDGLTVEDTGDLFAWDGQRIAF